MPICILLAPEAASHEAKVGMMRRLTHHIDEAYPVTTTHIFLREANPGDVMLAGSLLSELPGKDAGARGVRVCFLI